MMSLSAKIVVFLHETHARTLTRTLSQSIFDGCVYGSVFNVSRMSVRQLRLSLFESYSFVLEAYSCLFLVELREPL